MDGESLRKLRERRGISTDDLALLLNQSLGKNYSGETVARWERGRTISKSVDAFLDELAVQWGLDDGLAPPLAGERIEQEEWQPTPGGPAGDDSVPPGPGPTPAPQPRIGSGSSTWALACTELWEMIASGVGMVGAVVRSDALMMDGAIIDADKQALGQAWGKLAETNETFRKMLVGMTEGGAWLQVAMVTGTTMSKCWQSHGQFAQQEKLNGERIEPDADDLAA